MNHLLDRLLPYFLLFLAGILFFSTLKITYQKVGELHPGYLTFDNGVVGAFYVPGWSGPQRGMNYHDQIAAVSEPTEILSLKDYLLVVALPSISGFLFVLLGMTLVTFLPFVPGRLPLLFFHFLAGVYLILSPDFHLTYRFTWIFLCSFAFIPATMIHFSVLFPEQHPLFERRRVFYFFPYLLSGLLLFPYLYFFESRPSLWIVTEYFMVLYVISSYLYWISRLVRTLKRPQLQFSRIIARTLLLGQVTAFMVPFLAAVAIFVGGISFPINLATPLTLLFPSSLFIGVVLGRLRQGQMQLVQQEKLATTGSLLSGLAHEINNPLTFIYSNMEPLRESLTSLRGAIVEGDTEAYRILKDLDELATNVEEGATRAKAIIDDFRNFTHPGDNSPVPVDLVSVLEQGIHLLTPRWKGRIDIQRDYGCRAKVMAREGDLGQIFLNILANAFDALEDGGQVTVSIRRQSSKVEVTISDSGCGIQPNDLARIFDPFYTTKAPGKGTGLGLAITLQLVKKNGGSIEVKSSRQEGTSVHIHFPELKST